MIKVFFLRKRRCQVISLYSWKALENNLRLFLEHNKSLFLFEEFSDKTVRLFGCVLLREMIGAFDKLKVELFEASLGHFSAISRHVLVAFAEHEQAGNEAGWARQRWIGEEEFSGGSIIVDWTGESAFLRENIFVDFKVVIRLVLHHSEEFQIVEADGELGQERHLVEENVPRHQELLQPGGD